MKWPAKSKEPGQTRTVRRFAFWPTKAYQSSDPKDTSEIMVWLETYAVEQEVEYVWAFLSDRRVLRWVSGVRYALWPQP